MSQSIGPGNLRPIGPQGVTPRVLLEQLAKDIDEIDQLFCIAFAKKNGEVWQYLSGDVKSLAFGTLTLQETAMSASTEAYRDNVDA
jgi:hypothetical protein